MSADRHELSSAGECCISISDIGSRRTISYVSESCSSRDRKRRSTTCSDREPLENESDMLQLRSQSWNRHRLSGINQSRGDGGGGGGGRAHQPPADRLATDTIQCGIPLIIFRRPQVNPEQLLQVTIGDVQSRANRQISANGETQTAVLYQFGLHPLLKSASIWRLSPKRSFARLGRSRRESPIGSLEPD